MNGDDLWSIASGDHDEMAREAALARADAELEGVMPFLLAARTGQEYLHRQAMVMDSLEMTAARCGMETAGLLEIADRRCRLYREALMEGTDPLISLEQLLSGSGQGSGPEDPDQHDEGPDFSHGYSEVPMGILTGPSPDVTRPRPPHAGPVQEATGMRRRADSSMMTTPYTPPDLGTGGGSTDVGVPSGDTAGMTPSIPTGGGAVPQPGLPAGVSAMASLDPVRRKVFAVTAMVSRSNPGLSRAECERIARLAVGRFIREADLTDSVMSDGPMTGGGQGGSGGSGGGNGGGAVSHMLEGQGLRSMMPGMGGGAAAGEAGAGAGEAAEAVGLLAL